METDIFLSANNGASSKHSETGHNCLQGEELLGISREERRPSVWTPMILLTFIL